MLPIGRVGGLQNLSSPLHEMPCSAASMACYKCTSHGITSACDDNRHPECCRRDSRLTFEEQRSMMTLWSISRSTLFVGGDPAAMSDAQASLFLNTDVLFVNSNGSNPRQVFCLPESSCSCNLTNPPAESAIVWASDLNSHRSSSPPADTAAAAATQQSSGIVEVSYVALFNNGNRPSVPSVLGALRSQVRVNLKSVRSSWGPGSDCKLEDLWQGRSLGKVPPDGSIAVSLAMHDAALLSVTCMVPFGKKKGKRKVI